MKRISILCCLFIFISQVWAQIPLFPTPAKYSVQKGNFEIHSQTIIEGQDEYSRQLAVTFEKELEAVRLPRKQEKNVIKLTLNPDVNLAKDGYRLHITSESATLEASSASGLFYAKESFMQLARAGKGTLPTCRIEDAPRYSWRGFMLDESRHFFGKEKVKQYLDRTYCHCSTTGFYGIPPPDCRGRGCLDTGKIERMFSVYEEIASLSELPGHIGNLLFRTVSSGIAYGTKCARKRRCTAKWIIT